MLELVRYEDALFTIAQEQNFSKHRWLSFLDASEACQRFDLPWIPIHVFGSQGRQHKVNLVFLFEMAHTWRLDLGVLPLLNCIRTQGSGSGPTQTRFTTLFVSLSTLFALGTWPNFDRHHQPTHLCY